LGIVRVSISMACFAFLFQSMACCSSVLLMEIGVLRR
jgi:hypothetical protein